MAYNIGLNVVEVDGRAAPTIAAAPTSVAGFLVRSQRGIPNLPVLVRGFGDFVSNFGGFMDAAFGAHAVRGFFENGGTEAYAVRIARDGVAANLMLTDRKTPAAANTLSVVAGRRGRPDPGAWGNALSVAVVDHPRGSSVLAAQIVSEQAEPYALANNQQLSVLVNESGAPVTITFDASDFANIGAASAAEVARVINRQTAAFRAGVAPNRRLVLSSTTSGSASRLAASGAAATPLGFTGAAANSEAALAANSTLAVLKSTGGFLPASAIRLETRGHVVGSAPIAAALPANSKFRVAVDNSAPVTVSFSDSDFVNGIGSVAPGEVVAAINRQAQGFNAELTYNNRLVILSKSYGTNSTIVISAGTPDASVALGLSTPTPVNGAREYRAVELVSETYKFITWSGGLPAGGLPVNATRIQSVEFDLIVYRDGQEVERFESLSMQDTLDYYAEAVINDPDRGSGYITVGDENSASGAGLDAPAERRDPVSNQLLAYPLAAGGEGVMPQDMDFIGDPAQRTGLYAFDTVRIQLLACPESTSAGLVAASLAYCESRGDAMFVGSSPRGFDLEGIKTYAGAFRGRKVFGALYAPWIQIVNPADATGNNPRVWIPPVGHVLGMYARLGDTRGVWKAPAGDEAQLRNVLGVEFEMTDTDHNDLVKNGSVNGIRAIPGSGIIVDSSRTLSTDTRWLFVNVRRLFNYVKTSLRDGLRFVSQEPHSEELRRMVKYNVVTPFLLGLWRQGAFGSDAAEQVFTVICGPENNPPSEVNQGNFKVEVYFYPVKPAETIIIVVGQQESGATASEP